MKNALIKILSLLPISYLFRPFFQGQGSILFMHKVVSKKEAQTPRIELMEANEIEAAYLEKMIVFLKKKGYAFISLDELNAIFDRNQKPSKRFVVFTFDDGYRDNFTLAYPVFKKHNVPFTIYVTNCYPNHTAKLWWYLLEDIILENDTVSLKTENFDYNYSTATKTEKNLAFLAIREKIISSPPHVQDNIFEALEKGYRKSLRDYVLKESLAWKDIIEISKDPLVTIGAHSMNHYTFNTLSKKDLLDEVVASQRELEERTNNKVHHFAYPFGTPNEVNEREAHALENGTNLKTATTTRMGNIFMEHRNHRFALPRIQVLGNQQDLSILNLYLSGVIPALKNRFKKIMTL